MEIWDGYNRNGTLAGTDLIRGKRIPQGLYHLVCEVLVRHTDGDCFLMRRAATKPNYGGYWEATAGGSALKGEDKFTCIKRELLEETGISANDFTELGRFVFEDSQCIFYTFLCVTDCDKASVRLQDGETDAYKWVTEQEFIAFVNSDKMIKRQKKRYSNYFAAQGYIIAAKESRWHTKP